MNLVSWSPCREMEGFFDRYNRLLSDRELEVSVMKRYAPT